MLEQRDFTKLDAILHEYSDNLRNLNVGRWGDLNGRLHSLLYRHADSPRIEATVQQLLQDTDRFTRMQLSYTDGRERAEREHASIVQCCRKGDYDAAAAALRAHIEGAGTALVGLLRDRQRALEPTVSQTSSHADRGTVGRPQTDRNRSGRPVGATVRRS